MNFRKLRIAWLGAWGIVTVLLCVLSVRSYCWTYVLTAQDSRFATSIGVENGGLNVAYFGVPKLSQLRLFWGSNEVTFDGELQSHLGFYFGPHPVDSSASLVVVPIWLFILLAIAVAPLSWMCNLPLGFSVRTLLIATTLVAAVLGLIVWAAR